MEQQIDRALNNRFSFCTGVAILVVLMPPNWQEWIGGDFTWEQYGIMIPAVAAVARGALNIAGLRIPGKKETQNEPNQ